VKNLPVSPAETGSLEQRRHARYPLMALVEALEPKSNTQITGRTSDVSLSGCYVDTLNPFPEGTMIRIRLTREKVSFEANANVVFSQMGVGMGVAFTSAEKDQFQIYQKWINQLSGNLSPDLDLPEEKPQRSDNADLNLNEGQYYVLNELVLALMRKGVLTDAEGKAMLNRLQK
jgi:PilZ domain